MRRTKRSWLRPWVYLPAILIMIGMILFFARTGGRPLTSTPKRNPGLVPSGILSRGTLAPGLRLPRNASKGPDATTQARLSETYGKLPLSFEANRGQTDGQVKFLSRGRGYTLFLTSAEAVLALRKPQAAAQKHRFPLPSSSSKREDEGKGKGTVLRMKLVGANPAPRVAGLEELPGKSNYFIGNDPQKWHTNVPNYAKVQYQNVYPGVNLVYYGNQRQLEYDFVVAPGANPKAIRLAFEGTQKLRTDAQGNLVLHTQGGEVRFQKPLIYQEINSTRQEIPGHYVLQGKDQVGFQVAAYDPTRPLVIDPVLVYSTYLGGTGIDFGSGSDIGYGIAVDASGNAYVTGYTTSINFPTQNPIQGSFAGGFYDAFVTKLNSAGSALVYSTYLGGSTHDQGQGIAVDGSGNAYVIPTSCAMRPGMIQKNPLKRLKK